MAGTPRRRGALYPRALPDDCNGAECRLCTTAITCRRVRELLSQARPIESGIDRARKAPPLEAQEPPR